MHTAGRAGFAAVTAWLLLAACTDRGAPAAVALVDDAPAIAWKFCDSDRGVGAVTVAANTEDQPAVWRATLRPGAAALATVPVMAQVEGYDVETTEGWPLRSDRTYTVTDAVDAQGTSLPPPPDFAPAELDTDEVLYDDGSGRLERAAGTVSQWLQADEPGCD